MVKEQKNKKNYLQICGWALVAVAIICSLTLWGQRLASEKAYKTVQVSVNYTDVASLANGNQLSVPQMLDILKTHGVSAVLFKEVSVGDLERLGKVDLTLGEQSASGCLCRTSQQHHHDPRRDPLYCPFG